jgi:hypothetical protein
VLHLQAPTLEALFVQAALEMNALAGASAKRTVLIRRPVEIVIRQTASGYETTIPFKGA